MIKIKIIILKYKIVGYWLVYEILSWAWHCRWSFIVCNNYNGNIVTIINVHLFLSF